MSDKKPRPVRSIVSLVLTIAVIATAGWLYLNRQFAYDQYNVWSFAPSAAVTTLESSLNLTDKGQFYFRTTHPEVATGDSFNTSCPRQESTSPILGCYSANRIFIYDVTNQELEGIEEVTAAHELLHAAWDRLSDDEKSRVGALLQQQYDGLDNAELKARMAYYERTEPGQFINELHSILGTEVRTLSPELESYYSTYFQNRQAILSYHDAYDSVFRDLTTKAAALSGTLESLATQIRSLSQEYEQGSASLESDIDSFNRRAAANQFTSRAAFNAERAALVSRSNALEAQRQSINALITQHADQYQEYTVVSSRLQQLNRSIDSFDSLQPAPAV